MFASFPLAVLTQLQAAATAMIKGLDAPTLNGLEKRGFMLHDGPKGAGFLLREWRFGCRC